MSSGEAPEGSPGRAGGEQDSQARSTGQPSLPVGSEGAADGDGELPPQPDSGAASGDGSDDDDFVPPLPEGPGPGQALVLHESRALSGSESESEEDTSSEEEEDESLLPPGPISPARCTATGQGFSGGPSGAPVKMVITAKDRAGRRIREGGAYVLVRLQVPRPTGPQLAAEGEVIDHGDGTYTVTYTCPAKGSYEVRALCDGAWVGGSVQGGGGLFGGGGSGVGPWPGVQLQQHRRAFFRPPLHARLPRPSPLQLSVEINGEPMGHSPSPIFFAGPQPNAEASAAAGPAPGAPTVPPAAAAAGLPGLVSASQLASAGGEAAALASSLVRGARVWGEPSRSPRLWPSQWCAQVSGRDAAVQALRCAQGHPSIHARDP